ncbi:MAG: acyl-CoA/acyl-ACP dehydrogenase [Chloroflexi bacterium]|nr:acyl-CoA/acyl-ACP dehydrogenase [Chloroflexota bacterium]
MTDVAIAAAPNSVLTEDMLGRFLTRSSEYDRENKFFFEDLEEFKEAGYLKLAVPKELGGGGLNLAEMSKETGRLGKYAPATALALNMHVYWTGIAADLWRSGDKSLEWLLHKAIDGEIFAAGHAESGNDMPLLLSTTNAEPVEGGYKFTGKKSFGSLSPVWTWMGLHGMDTSDPENPKIVHAFLPRDSKGLKVVENWDVLGMRATQSHGTELDGVFVPTETIARVVPIGATGIDHFVIATFAWALFGFANIYYGMAERAIEMTVESLQKRKSLALTRSYAYHPDYQHELAEMVIEFEGIGPHIEKIAEDWSNGVDYGAEWGLKIVAAKYRAVEGAWKIIDTALELAGGFGIFKASGLEQLWRDGRLGRIHPASGAVTREFVAKTALGINPDEQPRWG